MTLDVTVAVLTFNGEEFLEDLLNAVYSQKTKHKYEILIIDSGSTDSTLEICAKFPELRLEKIKNKDFGHGKTRNLAVDLSNSKYVLFLTQDAVPANHYWMDAMVEPFETIENTSCVFGKQIPRPNCNVTCKREVAAVFSSFGDDVTLGVHRISDVTENVETYNSFFSDANSAVLREKALIVPFRDIDYSEDIALAIDHMKHGWFKVYAPLGQVMHSHDLSPKKFYKRKVEDRIGAYKATQDPQIISFTRALRRFITGTLRDFSFVIKDKEYSLGTKLKNLAMAPVYNFYYVKALRKTNNPA